MCDCDTSESVCDCDTSEGLCVTVILVRVCV